MTEKAKLELYLKTGEILRLSDTNKHRTCISGFHSIDDTNEFMDCDGNVYIISSTNISYMKIFNDGSDK